MQPGDTFLYQHPHDHKHLMIVVCKTIDDPINGETIHCVYLTTLYNTGDEDKVCIFKAQDHPFITHDSYIEYSQLLHIRVDYLQNLIAIGSAKPKSPITSQQLTNIKNGALVSDSIRPSELKYFT